MKTIIAGNCSIEDYSLVVEAISRIDWKISEIVSAGSDGVDRLSEKYANENNIQLKIYQAERELYGKAAIPIRNAQMAKYSDALIAIWDRESQGSVGHMIGEANELGLKTVVFLKDELRTKKQGNPIRNNPVFGDEVEKRVKGEPQESLATKTISFNGKNLVIYENPSRNQPIVNMVAELVDEVQKLKKKT